MYSENIRNVSMFKGRDIVVTAGCIVHVPCKLNIESLSKTQSKGFLTRGSETDRRYYYDEGGC